MSGIDRLAIGYQPNFDIDQEAGHRGELFVLDILAALKAGSIEIKTDYRACATDRIYIETACLMADAKWHPSGIAATPAEVCAIVLPSPTGKIMIAIATATLRAMARRAHRAGWNASTTRGSHPTKGVIIPLAAFLRWALDGADS